MNYMKHFNFSGRNNEKNLSILENNQKYVQNCAVKAKMI